MFHATMTTDDCGEVKQFRSSPKWEVSWIVCAKQHSDSSAATCADDKHVSGVRALLDVILSALGSSEGAEILQNGIMLKWQFNFFIHVYSKTEAAASETASTAKQLKTIGNA